MSSFDAAMGVFVIFVVAVLCYFCGHDAGVNSQKRKTCQESCQLSGFTEARWTGEACECLEVRKP